MRQMNLFDRHALLLLNRNDSGAGRRHAGSLRLGDGHKAGGRGANTGNQGQFREGDVAGDFVPGLPQSQN